MGRGFWFGVRLRWDRLCGRLGFRRRFIEFPRIRHLTEADRIPLSRFASDPRFDLIGQAQALAKKGSK
jgi:hypothetical protein